MPPLLKGCLIGFSIAAPVGPIGLLCIRRAMIEGRIVGFVSGLGAATADAVYGAIAAAGLTAITNTLLAQRLWLQLFGGAFLIYLGIQTWRSKSADGAANAPGRSGVWPAYASTFALTLANPMTVLSFLGIFAGLGITDTDRGVATAGALVGGVFLGSSAWWLTLSLVAGWLGARMRPSWLRGINVAAALIILGFGVWQVSLVVRSLR